MAIAPATRYSVPTIAGKIPPALPEIHWGLGQEFPRECRKAVDDDILQDDDEDGEHDDTLLQ